MFSKKTRNLSVAVLAIIMAFALGFGVMGFNTEAPQVSAAETVWTIFDGQSATISNGSTTTSVPVQSQIGETSITHATGAKFTASRQINFEAVSSNNVYGGVTYPYAFVFSGTPGSNRNLCFVIPAEYTAKFEIVWGSGGSNRQLWIGNAAANADNAVAGGEKSATLKNATGFYQSGSISEGTYYLNCNGSATYIYSIKITLTPTAKTVVTALANPQDVSMYVGDTRQLPEKLTATIADSEATEEVAVKWVNAANEEVTSFTAPAEGTYIFTATVNDNGYEAAETVTATLTIEVKELVRTITNVEVGSGYFMLLNQTLAESTLPSTLVASWTAEDDGESLTGTVELAVAWAFADGYDATEPGVKAVIGTLTVPNGFEIDVETVQATVTVKNAKTVEFTFDFPNDAALTEEEWASIPGFSGTDIKGTYAGNAITENGTSYNSYLNIYKSSSAILTYTLPVKAYVTVVEIAYAGGSSSNFDLVVTANYVGGATKEVKLSTNGNWVVVRGTAEFDSMEQVETITFQSGNKEKNLAIKSIKITYVSLAGDSVVTLDVNGGDELDQTTFNIIGGNSFTLPNATKAATENAAYNLMGWLCGETLYAVGEVVFPEEDMTFVAQWEEVAKNTPVTGVTLEQTEVEVLINGAVKYPTTVVATYGDGKTVILDLTLASEAVNTSVVGVYTLIYNVDDVDGFYLLGEFATVEFKVTVYEWMVVELETVNITVKQGNPMTYPETIMATVRKWNGSALYGEYETKSFAITWEPFNTDQEIGAGYKMVGTLTAEEGYNFGEEFDHTTANVEINNFNYSTVKSIWFIEKESYNELEAYGYKKGGTTLFDESKDDQYWGFKLDAGGYIQFTLDKEARVVIGLSGLASKNNVKFQFGLVNPETGELTELAAISTFEQEQYQVIDKVLQPGIYKLINNATDSKMNVNVSYIQILDGGSKFFIPSTSNNVAPENTDKENFIGWTDGTVLYTVGATMTVATTNKGTVAYEPVYGDVASFGTMLNYTLLGYYQASSGTLVSAIDTTVATSYTAINVKATWTVGAALRIAGASDNAEEDNSALKFILNLEFAENYAQLVANLENNNLEFLLEGGEAELTFVKKVVDAKNLTFSVYVEKVASLGLIDTALAPKVSVNGSEFEAAVAYTAKYVAEKALADTQDELVGDYKFELSEGVYSRFNETERLELQKYLDLAPNGEDNGEEGELPNVEDEEQYTDYL